MSQPMTDELFRNYEAQVDRTGGLFPNDLGEVMDELRCARAVVEAAKCLRKEIAVTVDLSLRWEKTALSTIVSGETLNRFDKALRAGGYLEDPAKEKAR